MDEPELLMTAEEVAAALGVHPKTVNRWTREDACPVAGHLPGGRPRYRWTEVAEWLKNSRAGAKK